ncbi:hypothetical protein R1flu_017213 [Riccia fluitans]|uniref:Uncharacterized protein n=1 Tax=Riccia fluitans TaxID=41844 RepID=A0ABD1XEU7_9MARC
MILRLVLLEADYADGKSSEIFDLRKIAGERKGLHRLLHNWAVAGTGRWCRVARSKFLLEGSVGVKRKGDVGTMGDWKEKDDEPSVKMTLLTPKES